MANIETNIERYIPSQDTVLPRSLVLRTSIVVSGRNIPHIATADFPPSDPWSKTMRRQVAVVRKEGCFRGKPVTEFGIGDGRNIREVGDGLTEVIGVDIEKWRLQVAGVNLVTGSMRLQSPVELWRADAVDFLQNLKNIGRNKLSGWVLMCLPQSPEGLNTADRYDGYSTLDPYRTDWDRFGLTLNAAALDNLRKVATPNLKALIILSDRIPPESRAEMITRTGWNTQRQFRTLEPIQQDPDTGVSWVGQVDDGSRFYELTEPGSYSPILASEAEIRRRISCSSGLGRRELNVYHHLSVYQLESDRR